MTRRCPFSRCTILLPEKKRALFERLAKALKPGGVYVQCDYAAESEESEARYFQELARLKREAHLPEDAFYHYDTPLTEEHEMQLLREAGFVSQVGEE